MIPLLNSACANRKKEKVDTVSLANLYRAIRGTQFAKRFSVTYRKYGIYNPHYNLAFL